MRLRIIIENWYPRNLCSKLWDMFRNELKVINEVNQREVNSEEKRI